MAEKRDVAFETLGRIVVDLDALDKSLDAAEVKARSHGKVLQRIWDDSSKQTTGGAMGLGEAGVQGTMGRADSVFGSAAKAAAVALAKRRDEIKKALFGADAEVATSGAVKGLNAVVEATGRTTGSFSALARTAQVLISGPLSAISPVTGQAASSMLMLVGRMAAFGGVIGIVIATAVVLTRTIMSYISAAQEASAKTLEVSQALKGVGGGGAVEAQVKKISQGVDELSQSWGEVTGKAGAWQKIIAAIAVTTNRVFGMSMKDKMEDLLRATSAAIDASNRLEMPGARAEARGSAADLAEKQAQLNLQNATTAGERAAAEADLAQAIKDKTSATIDSIKADFEAAKAAGKTNAKKMASIKIASAEAAGEQRLRENEDRQRKVRAQADAESESYVQRDIQRGQKRLENNMATAMAIEKAEADITKVRREQAGEVESAASQEADFTKEREHSTATLVAGIKAANAEYASQRRALEGLIAAGVNAIANQEKLTDLERTHADDIIARKNKIAQVTAENAAREAQERQRRNQEEIALEERQLAHRVAMGRVSIQDQMGVATAGRSDPRRTAAQQEQAEEQLLGLKREYAERYFKLYNQLGTSMWQGQLESAKSFLSQTVEGSRAWFDQVTKISDIYKAIHDQAKSVFQQELGIAATEAQREGRTRMRLADVDKYVEKVRRRDEKILRGGSGTIADVTGAVSRRDLFQTVDREGLSPREAFARMQQDPQQQLAETINSVATRQSSAAETQVAATNQFAMAVDKFDAAVDRIGSGGGRGNDVNPAPASAPSARGVLPTKGPRAFSNMMLSADTSSLLGRGLYLEGKRGPAATESAL